MGVAYVTSVFPCLSETFILDEIADHSSNGVDLAIFSLKRCNENTMHHAATSFIARTVYPYSVFDPRLWIMHVLLAMFQTSSYFGTLLSILFMKSSDRVVWLKSVMVFILSPRFVFVARSRNITHLHAHFATYPALLAWIVGRLTEVPFSVTAHAHDIYVNRDILSLVWTDASSIVTISKYNKRFLLQELGKSAEDKVWVVHCGINRERFPYSPCLQSVGKPSGSFRIVSIGRLTEIKGFPILIDALALLKREGLSFECEIVGDGPLRASLEEKIRDLDLGTEVRLLGSKKVEEIPEILGRANVFVLACSRGRTEGQDGIPVVFMEAMALGIPVIGTRISGVPELIRDGETGLCVEEGEPRLIKDAVKYVISNTDAAERMRHGARQLIEKEFSIEKNSALLRDIFGVCGRSVSAIGRL